MRPHPRAVTAALLAGVAGLAGSYFVTGLRQGFVGAAVASIITDLTPGFVLTFAITGMGDLAQPLSFAAALVVAVLLYAAAALVGIEIGRRRSSIFRPALLAAAGGWLLTLVLTGRVVSPFTAGIAMFVAVAIASNLRSPYVRSFEPSRRRLLGVAASVAGMGAGSYLLRRNDQPFERVPLDLDAATRAEIEAGLEEARRKSFDLGEMDPLVSERFYEVDINSINPTVETEEWTLTVTGAVEEEVEFTLEDLRSREPENRFETLRCVGESLNGHKMDTALWTGVPVADLLEEVTIESDCECVMLRATDGYYEEFPLEALRGGMIAVGMNGEALPVRHGYPARALVPGHWGEINVKWLTEIEVLDEEAIGYWESRGWHGTGPVNTVAKIHAVERGGDGVTVGGHAYAGLRGISAVEVSTDGGDTWTEATLSDPLPGEDVWRQWKHTLDIDGKTEVIVRAVEADGTVQPREESNPFPSGPSGWVSKTIEP